MNTSASIALHVPKYKERVRVEENLHGPLTHIVSRHRLDGWKAVDDEHEACPGDHD